MMLIKKIALSLMLIACMSITACGSADGDVGTVITRPKPPTVNAFPDFDAVIPETTLGSGESDESLSSLKTPFQETNLNVINVWNDVVVDGGFADSRLVRDILESFGEELAGAIENEGITEVTDSPQTVSLAETILVDTTSSWEVELIQDSNDENFIRFYFTNSQTSQIQAAYILQTDDNQNPVKGLLAYVNPDLLSEEANDNSRLFSMAFDFSDSTTLQMVVRMEPYREVDESYHAEQIHYECFSEVECTGEFLQIRSVVPQRELDDTGFRFTWNEETNAVCLADMDYSSGSAEVVNTFSFTGPEGPTEDNTEIDACQTTPPLWEEHIFTENDLIERYEDTDPVGGTALEYYQDGASKTGWDSLTPQLIDSWLDASAF